MSASTEGLVSDNLIDPTVAAIIRRKASRMVGRAGLGPQDRADLEQELTLYLLTRRDQFNSARGTWAAFAWRLVHRHGENLVRYRQAAKRDRRSVVPLTREPAAPDATNDRSDAVDAAVATLPAELRAVAEQVMATGNVAAAARALGVSRSTVAARLREIRQRAEFQEFGDNP